MEISYLSPLESQAESLCRHSLLTQRDGRREEGGIAARFQQSPGNAACHVVRGVPSKPISTFESGIFYFWQTSKLATTVRVNVFPPLISFEN